MNWFEVDVKMIMEMHCFQQDKRAVCFNLAKVASCFQFRSSQRWQYLHSKRTCQSKGVVRLLL
jgi:hypothetical protein